MAKKPETNFRTNTVLPFLKKLQNTEFFPIQQKAICGDPDYLLCINGTFVGLELKRPKGKLSKLQSYKLGRITETKGVALVADPTNWGGVAQRLVELAGGLKV